MITDFGRRPRREMSLAEAAANNSVLWRAERRRHRAEMLHLVWGALNFILAIIGLFTVMGWYAGSGRETTARCAPGAADHPSPAVRPTFQKGA